MEPDPTFLLIIHVYSIFNDFSLGVKFSHLGNLKYYDFKITVIRILILLNVLVNLYECSVNLSLGPTVPFVYFIPIYKKVVLPVSPRCSHGVDTI